MMLRSASLLMVALPVVLCIQCSSSPLTSNIKECQDWHIGLDRVKPSGTVVHGHASSQLSESVQGNVHGSKVFGGPQNGAQTIGGGLNYQHSNGLHGSVDATHHRGIGTGYTATVGGSTKVGPGTLSVGGGGVQLPGSSKVQGQVGATYSVPLP